MMKQLLFVCLLLACFHLQAQEDGEREFIKAKHDTTRIRILLEMSDASEDLGVMTYAERALTLVNKNLPFSSGQLKEKYLGDKAFALNNIGYGYRNFSGDNKKAIECFKEALAIYEQIGEAEGLTDCITNLQEVYLSTGDFTNAKIYINKALVIQRAANDSSAIAETYSSLGTLFDSQGNQDSSLFYLQKSLDIRERLDEKKYVAFTLDNIGTIYSKKGDLNKALQYYYKSYNYCDKYLEKSEAALGLYHIGTIYMELHDYNKALDYSKRALLVLESVKSRKNLPLTLDNIGFIYRKLHSSDSAFVYYNRALEAAREADDNLALSAILYDVGEAYIETRDTAAAMKCYREALDLSKQLSAKDRVADGYYRIGTIFLAQGKIDSAMYYGTQALKLSQETNVVRYSMNINYLMSRVNRLKGNYKDALTQFDKYITIRDSLNSNVVYRNAVSNEFQHEQEKRDLIAKAEQQKKQLEIEEQKKIRWISIIAFAVIMSLSFVLFRINQKRKQNYFERNLAEMQMKALRAQMNPHFIFNCMNSIQNFMLKNNMPDAVKYQQKFATLIRMMLDHSDVKTVSLKEELDLLVLYMQLENLRLANGFDFEIKVDDTIEQEETEIPSMLLQPHVENAIWHGLSPLKEKGYLKISVTKNQTVLHCVVEDNGIGIKASAAHKENKQHHSKGMNITSERLALLNKNSRKENTIRIIHLNETGNGNGTRIEIDIPLTLNG